MRKSNLLISALFLIAAILTFSGCGKDENPVLAKVGGDEITTRELNEIFTRNAANFLTADDEFNSRRIILDSLIMQQLLIQEAYRKHIDALEEVNRIVLGNTDRFLLDILYQREIADKLKITDNNIRDFYDKLEYKIKVSHILTRTEDTARMILDSLRAGAIFEDLAVRYSIDPSARTNRGDLGFIIWGRMDATFQEQIFKMNPGELSEPFATSYGWHIAKFVDRQPNEFRQSFEQMKSGIKTSIENMQSVKLMEDFRKRLKEKFPIKVESATCEHLMYRRAALYPPQLLESLPKNDFDMAQLERDEKEMVLATWEGGQITLGQYLSTIRSLRRQYPGLPAPNFDQYDSLANFIFQISSGELLAQEARAQGLENDAEFKRKIKRFKELAMADVMENDSLPMPALPDEGELRQYYENHLDEFKIPPKIHLYEIMVSDLVKAKEIAATRMSPARFKEMADQWTERPGKRGTGGDLGDIQERYYPELYQAAERAALGDIVGPISHSGKYSIIYVADKKAEEISDFLMVKQRINEVLSKERRQKALADWVEQKKREVDVKVYEDNLRATIDAGKYTTVDSTRG